MWICEPHSIKPKTAMKPVHISQIVNDLVVLTNLITISAQLIRVFPQSVCGNENQSRRSCADAADDPFYTDIQFAIRIHQLVDLLNRVNHRGVMLAPELPGDFRIAFLGQSLAEVHGNLSRNHDITRVRPTSKIINAKLVVISNRLLNSRNRDWSFVARARDVAHGLLGESL